MSIVTLTGSQQQVKTELLKLKKDFKDKHGDLALETIDDQEADKNTIISAVSSMPFLAEKKMVVLMDLSLNKNVESSLEEILETVSDEVELVIVERKLDKRSKTFKTLKSMTVFKDLSPRTGNSLLEHVVEQAKELGLSMSRQDAEYLIMQVGENEIALNSELIKLNAAGKTDKKTIDMLVDKQPTSKVFDLLESAMNKKIAQTEKIYNEQRAQKVEPQSILGLIVWQLQVLALAKTGKNLDEVATKAGMSSYPLKRAQAVVAKLSYELLVELVESACEVDLAIKSGANPDEAVRLLLAELSV